MVVVDDEVNIRNALVTMLEKKGYQVRGVGTAEEALEQLEAATVELVITDLRMPGIGGMEFLRRLKDKWPDTEVVVMTAYVSSIRRLKQCVTGHTTISRNPSIASAFLS